MRQRQDLATRFWSKVDKSGECWLWTGCRDDQGYGRFTVEKGTTVGAHRMAYELEYGPLPPGFCACHTCDNPPCVRPVHLFKGTRADNMRDRYLKGRYGGLVIPPLDGLLLPAQVVELRHIWSNPDHPPAYELAQMYGVTRAVIFDALEIDAA